MIRGKGNFCAGVDSGAGAGENENRSSQTEGKEMELKQMILAYVEALKTDWARKKALHYLQILLEMEGQK